MNLTEIFGERFLFQATKDSILVNSSVPSMGLICLTRCSNWFMPLEICIVNPATREVLLLPKAPLCNYKYPVRIEVAFGSEINEYQVYGVFDKSSEFQEDKHIECEVHSSMTQILEMYRSCWTTSHEFETYIC